MANLGFIGLGLMGSRIVKKFLDAGHKVTGYNRTHAKAQWLVDAGMQWAESPRAVAEKSDIVFTMVSDTAALAQVGNHVVDGLGPGKIYVDMSTVSPRLIRELSARTAHKGAQMYLKIAQTQQRNSAYPPA